MNIKHFPVSPDGVRGLPSGWRKKIVRNANGKTIYHFYSPEGIMFDTKSAVQQALEMEMSLCKSKRGPPKHRGSPRGLMKGNAVNRKLKNSSAAKTPLTKPTSSSSQKRALSARIAKSNAKSQVMTSKKATPTVSSRTAPCSKKLDFDKKTMVKDLAKRITKNAIEKNRNARTPRHSNGSKGVTRSTKTQPQQISRKPNTRGVSATRGVSSNTKGVSTTKNSMETRRSCQSSEKAKTAKDIDSECKTTTRNRVISVKTPNNKTVVQNDESKKKVGLANQLGVQKSSSCKRDCNKGDVKTNSGTTKRVVSSRKSQADESSSSKMDNVKKVVSIRRSELHRLVSNQIIRKNTSRRLDFNRRSSLRKCIELSKRAANQAVVKSDGSKTCVKSLKTDAIQNDNSVKKNTVCNKSTANKAKFQNDKPIDRNISCRENSTNRTSTRSHNSTARSSSNDEQPSQTATRSEGSVSKVTPKLECATKKPTTRGEHSTSKATTRIDSSMGKPTTQSKITTSKYTPRSESSTKKSATQSCEITPRSTRSMDVDTPVKLEGSSKYYCLLCKRNTNVVNYEICCRHDLKCFLCDFVCKSVINYAEHMMKHSTAFLTSNIDSMACKCGFKSENGSIMAAHLISNCKSEGCNVSKPDQLMRSLRQKTTEDHGSLFLKSVACKRLSNETGPLTKVRRLSINCGMATPRFMRVGSTGASNKDSDSSSEESSDEKEPCRQTRSRQTDTPQRLAEGLPDDYFKRSYSETIIKARKVSTKSVNSEELPAKAKCSKSNSKSTSRKNKQDVKEEPESSEDDEVTLRVTRTRVQTQSKQSVKKTSKSKQKEVSGSSDTSDSEGSEASDEENKEESCKRILRDRRPNKKDDEKCGTVTRVRTTRAATHAPEEIAMDEDKIIKEVKIKDKLDSSSTKEGELCSDEESDGNSSNSSEDEPTKRTLRARAKNYESNNGGGSSQLNLWSARLNGGDSKPVTAAPMKKRKMSRGKDMAIIESHERELEQLERERELAGESTGNLMPTLLQQSLPPQPILDPVIIPPAEYTFSPEPSPDKKEVNISLATSHLDLSLPVGESFGDDNIGQLVEDILDRMNTSDKITDSSNDQSMTDYNLSPMKSTDGKEEKQSTIMSGNKPLIEQLPVSDSLDNVTNPREHSVKEASQTALSNSNLSAALAGTVQKQINNTLVGLASIDKDVRNEEQSTAKLVAPPVPTVKHAQPSLHQGIAPSPNHNPIVNSQVHQAVPSPLHDNGNITQSANNQNMSQTIAYQQDVNVVNLIKSQHIPISSASVAPSNIPASQKSAQHNNPVGQPPVQPPAQHSGYGSRGASHHTPQPSAHPPQVPQSPTQDVSQSPKHYTSRMVQSPAHQQNNSVSQSPKHGANVPQSPKNRAKQSPSHGGGYNVVQSPNHQSPLMCQSPLHQTGSSGSVSQSPVYHMSSMSQSPAHQGSSVSQSPAHQGNSVNQSPAHQGSSVNQSPAHQGTSMGQSPAHQGSSVSQSPAHHGTSMGQSPAHHGSSVNQSPAYQSNVMAQSPDHPTLNGGTPVYHVPVRQPTPVAQPSENSPIINVGSPMVPEKATSRLSGESNDARSPVTVAKYSKEIVPRAKMTVDNLEQKAKHSMESVIRECEAAISKGKGVGVGNTAINNSKCSPAIQVNVYNIQSESNTANLYPPTQSSSRPPSHAPASHSSHMSEPSVNPPSLPHYSSHPIPHVRSHVMPTHVPPAHVQPPPSRSHYYPYAHDMTSYAHAQAQGMPPSTKNSSLSRSSKSSSSASSISSEPSSKPAARSRSGSRSSTPGHEQRDAMDRVSEHQLRYGSTHPVTSYDKRHEEESKMYALQSLMHSQAPPSTYPGYGTHHPSPFPPGYMDPSLHHIYGSSPYIPPPPAYHRAPSAYSAHGSYLPDTLPTRPYDMTYKPPMHPPMTDTARAAYKESTKDTAVPPYRITLPASSYPDVRKESAGNKYHCKLCSENFTSAVDLAKHETADHAHLAAKNSNEISTSSSTTSSAKLSFPW